MPKSQGDEIDFVFELRPGRGRHRICRYCVDASAGSFRPALMRVGMLYALAGRPAIQRGRDLIHINSPFGDLLHTSRYSNRGKMTLMRAVIKLMLLSLLTFAATFAARRIFFWDVMPVSWSQDPSPTGCVNDGVSVAVARERRGSRRRDRVDGRISALDQRSAKRRGYLPKLKHFPHR
jgi:hypothetical protein